MDSAKQSGSNSDDIFAVMGAGNIPDEDKGALLAKMLQVVQTRVLLKILDSLSDKEDSELNAIADRGDAEELEQFLRTHVPNYDQLFEDEAKLLRQELVIEFGK